MNELKDAANQSLTASGHDSQPSTANGSTVGNRPAASVAQPEPTKTQAPAGASVAPVASPDAASAASGASAQRPLDGEPDAATAPQWCKRCRADVVPIGKGRCPRCNVFLRQNFTARKHPVNVLRRDAILAELIADYRPTDSAMRMTCAALAGVFEQLEVMRPGSPDWQRLVQTSQTLAETLRANAPEPAPSQALAQVPMTALARSQALLERLAAGDTLSEREAGQLDVLQASMRGEIALAPEPLPNDAPVDAPPASAPPPAVDPAPAAPAPRIQCAFMNPNGIQCALDPMPGLAFCEYHSLDRDAHLKKENYELWLEVHSDSEEAIEVRRLRSTMTMLRTMFKPSPW